MLGTARRQRIALFAVYWVCMLSDDQVLGATPCHNNPTIATSHTTPTTPGTDPTTPRTDPTTPTVDPCASNRCMNGGTCVRSQVGFDCRCTQRFTGRTCEVLSKS